MNNLNLAWEEYKKDRNNILPFLLFKSSMEEYKKYINVMRSGKHQDSSPDDEYYFTVRFVDNEEKTFKVVCCDEQPPNWNSSLFSEMYSSFGKIQRLEQIFSEKKEFAEKVQRALQKLTPEERKLLQLE